VVASPTKRWIAHLHIEGDAPDAWQQEWFPLVTYAPSASGFGRAWLTLQQEFDHFVFVGFKHFFFS
jgi:hypothetical protein